MWVRRVIISILLTAKILSASMIFSILLHDRHIGFSILLKFWLKGEQGNFGLLTSKSFARVKRVVWDGLNSFGILLFLDKCRCLIAQLVLLINADTGVEWGDGIDVGLHIDSIHTFDTDHWVEFVPLLHVLSHVVVVLLSNVKEVLSWRKVVHHYCSSNFVEKLLLEVLRLIEELLELLWFLWQHIVFGFIKKFQSSFEFLFAFF